MPKPQIAARVEEEVDEQIEEISEERGGDKSDAIRHLIGRGIDYETGKLAVTDGGGPDRREVYAEAATKLAWPLLGAGAVVALAGRPTLSLALVGVAMLLSAVSLVEYVHRHIRRGEPDDNNTPARPAD